MKYLKIQNPGEICESAFVLMGASSKRDDDTKIGFFGTGIKYAIATLMRKGIPIKVYSGMKEITIEKVIEPMRGVDFETLVIAGRQTSITTQMGINWKTWQAIREIYCNAVDEGRVTLETVPEVGPVADHTVFYIGVIDDVLDVIDNWNDYFSADRTDSILKTKEFKVYAGGAKTRVYRKGICCFELDKPSLYHYDLESVGINEARLVENEWTLRNDIAKYWQKYATTDMLRRLFDHLKKEEFESSLGWSSYQETNSAWLDVIGNRKLVNAEVSGHFVDEIKNQNALVLNAPLVNMLSARFSDKVFVAGKSDGYGTRFGVPMSKKHEFLLKEVLGFFEEVGLPIKYEIEAAIFPNARIMGEAADGKIYISVNTFDQGKKYIAATLLEEVFHLESQCHDETRAFQDFLINKLLTFLEEKNALFL